MSDNEDKTPDNVPQESIKSEASHLNETVDSQEHKRVSFNALSNQKELTETLWGEHFKQEVFERWSQGFTFDQLKEPTALIQYNGGPCSVLTAVQAFILRELLLCPKCNSNKNDWRKPDKSELNVHFADALLSIFINVSSDNLKYLVFYEHLTENHANETENEQASDVSLGNQKNCKKAKLDYDAFKDRLYVHTFTTLNELKAKLYEKIEEYKNEFGVLCFVYSLLLTKRLDLLEKELEESRESLIDSLHGHGSQSLTNLMLSGIATSNVFDGEKSLEGLKLQGISKQSSIGFLTIMEYLRYCEVGWNYKNPKSPIWILASETHLTVFFSKETSLVQKNDTSRQTAIKTFLNYDPYENGFIKTDDLDKLMESLDLLTDKEYVDVVKQQLDAENLGIITKSAFLNEFFPESEENMIPNSFEVFHYNGLIRSNQENEVHYSKGIAKLIEFTDQPGLELSNLKKCIQTKWPTIEVDWIEGRAPSLN